jgi:protein-arginine kinase activator protein McsA
MSAGVAGFLLHSGLAICRSCARERSAPDLATIVSSQGASAIICSKCNDPLTTVKPEFDPALAEYCPECREVLVRYNGLGKSGRCSRCKTRHRNEARKEFPSRKSSAHCL